MKMKHVILRSTLLRTNDFRDYMVQPATRPTAAGLVVEVDAIDDHQAAALAQRSDVLAIATAMPMKLFTPVAVEPVVPGGGIVSWGIKAVGADTCPFTGENVTVAVLDTGIDAKHEAFAGVELVEKDFTGEGKSDNEGHGTHCAGTIFGRPVNGVRIGVAQKVKKALIGKVIGAKGGSSEQIVQAIQWATDNGANVISLSLGMDFPGMVDSLIRVNDWPPALATSRALEAYRANVLLFERLASLVRAHGNFSQATILIAAAGNESKRDVNPDYQIAVSPPAVTDGVISVGALGATNNGLVIAPFSNVGANVSAPGVEIVSAKLNGGLVQMSGTSMATPHVAGVAALWAEQLQGYGPLNAFQLTAKLVGAATNSGLRPGWQATEVGAGIVRAPQG